MRLARLFFLLLPLFAIAASADSILGTASSFAVLGASTVTNTGNTVLFGDLGVAPGTAITGFPPGIVNGTIHDNDAVAMQAQADSLTAYNFLKSQPFTQDLTGQDLGGQTLTPGVYFFASSAQLTGALTIDWEGLSNQNLIFQIGSTLTTASGSSILAINMGQNDNIYWQVGSSATLGTTTAFMGTIIADQSITLDHAATINCGRAIALNGAVTLDDNTVDNCVPGGTTPEPGTIALLTTGGAVVVGANSSNFSLLGMWGGLTAFCRRRKR